MLVICDEFLQCRCGVRNKHVSSFLHFCLFQRSFPLKTDNALGIFLGSRGVPWVLS